MQLNHHFHWKSCQLKLINAKFNQIDRTSSLILQPPSLIHDGPPQAHPRTLFVLNHSC